jgi:TolB protein
MEPDERKGTRVRKQDQVFAKWKSDSPRPLQGRMDSRALRKALFITAVVAVVGSTILPAQETRYLPAKEGAHYMFNYYFPPAPSSTPWWPAWAPDGKSIAVAMQGSIWRVDPSTGAAVELVNSGAKYLSSPAWSRDGKWLVYTADDDGKNIQLEILNVSTGESHALTTDRQIYADPVFSPDGTRLCYVSTLPSGYFNIYVRPIRDGQWAGEEIAVTRDHKYPHERLYFGAWDMHTQPAWTPDGKEIVFVSNRGIPLGSGDLWRMPAAPDSAGKAKSILHEQTLYRTRPDVSPDGKRIVYTSAIGGGDQYNHLYVIPIEGGAPYKLTFGDWDDFHPRWSPDGEWIAYISNEGGLPQLCLLETYGGQKKKILITKRHWKRPMSALHVRVVNKAGQLTSARIYLTAGDGKFYAPPDSYARIGLNDRHVFYTEGEFTVELPAGPAAVEAVRGFEYVPATGSAKPGGSLTLELRRLLDPPARGWYSGSTHVHPSYGGNFHTTLESINRVSRAEDQHMLNALVANKDNRVFDWQFFVPGGGDHPISRNDPEYKVVVGEEYRPPFWGHVFLIGLRDHLISPFTTGYEGTAIDSLYPSNTDIFRKAAAQGAVTGYVHAFGGDADPMKYGLGGGKAFPIDAALGTVNALEWSNAGHATIGVLHRIWNNDLHVAPAGGEDSMGDMHIRQLVGSVRTYVFTGRSLGAQAWQDGLRQGHDFFTTGPLLDFTIDGKLPGDELHLPAGGGTVTLEGGVTCLAPISKLVIYHNGSVLKDLPADHPFREQVHVTDSGWYSLYAEGPPNKFIDAKFPQAATNAIRVYVGDGKIRDRASAEYFIRWIDKLRALADAWPWWRSDAEKQHVFAQFDEARKVYEKLAGEARQ